MVLQDYDKYGVHDVIEKQALFKVIQGLNADDYSLNLSPEPSTSAISSQGNSSPEPLARIAADAEGDGENLLDLDGSDDDDFIQSFSNAFAQNFSPQGLPRPGTRAMSLSAAGSTNNAGAGGGEGSVGTPLPYNTSAGHAPQHRSSYPPSDNIGTGGPLGRTNSTAASAGNNNNNGGGGSHSAGARVSTMNAATSAATLSMIADPPRIRVIVRKRPLNRKEVERGDSDVLECDSDNQILYVHEPKTKVDLTKYTESHAFCFDDVFDEIVDNDSVYQRAIRPLIATLFRAGKGTCFAYGQTGSGKTYTMGPLPLRAAADIFALIQAVPEYRALSLHVACYEIYGGKVFDLLNSRQRLEVREDAKRKVQVVGLKELEVKEIEVLMRLCEHSAMARSTGQTGANDESSRSHSIMVFALRAPKPVEAFVPGTGRRPLPGKNDVPELRTIGKLSFIDLAGSERGADTYDNDKQTRLEGAEINKSLLALKECIRALDAEAKHIPFRGSKLTEVLRDSFVGKNARTVMIANVSPNSTSCEHTLNTLRYADRVKEIKKDAKLAAGAAAQQNNPNAQPAISEGAHALAALLHRMPPPQVPELNTTSAAAMQLDLPPLPQQQNHQQQQQQASALPQQPMQTTAYHTPQPTQQTAQQRQPPPPQQPQIQPANAVGPLGAGPLAASVGRGTIPASRAADRAAAAAAAAAALSPTKLRTPGAGLVAGLVARGNAAASGIGGGAGGGVGGTSGQGAPTTGGGGGNYGIHHHHHHQGNGGASKGLNGTTPAGSGGGNGGGMMTTPLSSPAPHTAGKAGKRAVSSPQAQTPGATGSVINRRLATLTAHPIKATHSDASQSSGKRSNKGIDYL